MSKKRDPWSLAEGAKRTDEPYLARARSEDEFVALAISEMLRGDSRSRAELADDLSVLLKETVSKAMLDAYASKARKDHGTPTHRFLGLAFLTGRWDVVDALFRRYDARIAARKDLPLLEIGEALVARDILDDHISRTLKLINNID